MVGDELGVVRVGMQCRLGADGKMNFVSITFVKSDEDRALDWVAVSISSEFVAGYR